MKTCFLNIFVWDSKKKENPQDFKTKIRTNLQSSLFDFIFFLIYVLLTSID